MGVTDPVGPEMSADIEDYLNRRPEGRVESAFEWWARAHTDGHAFWLSGTPTDEVWGRLGVEDRLVPGANVLDVGIGLGLCARDLAARGCVVSALDISQEAVDRVRDVATGYLDDEVDTLPDGAFDLATSHLVAQHMTDPDLLEQMRHVVRSLKPRGVFAIQYAADEQGRVYDQADPHNVKTGSIRRSVEAFDALVRSVGGRTLRTLKRETHPCGTIWYVAHVARAD